MVMWNTWPLLEGCIVVKVVATQDYGKWVGFKCNKVRKSCKLLEKCEEFKQHKS